MEILWEKILGIHPSSFTDVKAISSIFQLNVILAIARFIMNGSPKPLHVHCCVLHFLFCIAGLHSSCEVFLILCVNKYLVWVLQMSFSCSNWACFLLLEAVFIAWTNLKQQKKATLLFWEEENSKIFHLWSLCTWVWPLFLACFLVCFLTIQ